LLNKNGQEKSKFISIPKELIFNEKYKNLSSDAKIIYGILLMYMDSSNVVNEEHSIKFVTREFIRDTLSISRTTCVKAFKQLKDLELIEEIQQGLCKPNMIYINFHQKK
jgi:hypothetical protein